MATQAFDMVAERLIFFSNNEWLASALDPHAPDTTRWWLSIALLNGLSVGPLGQLFIKDIICGVYCHW